MKSSDFLTITESPLNGAPTPSSLVRSPITGAGEFFVRGHGEMPGTANCELRTANWGVGVEGMVRSTVNISVTPGSSLRDFGPNVSLEATLQCAGNRRTALQKIRPIPNEVPWPNEAISNAVWEGISLRDVLLHAGVADGAEHVWFTGGEPLTGKHAGEFFGASIPLSKAMDGTVMLADVMNGAPLAPEHGAPVRAIVPGYIGARSVKWLKEIRVERESSPNYFQRAYSVFPSSMLAVPKDNLGGIVLGEMPLNSAFATPPDGAHVAAGPVTLRGWALAGGDRTVDRVEVSPDGGVTWSSARFLTPSKRFVWRLWEADFTLARGEHEFVCRAFDDAGGTQPSDPASVWNVKGYANNSWDRARLFVG